MLSLKELQSDSFKLRSSRLCFWPICKFGKDEWFLSYHDPEVKLYSLEQVYWGVAKKVGTFESSSSSALANMDQSTQTSFHYTALYNIWTNIVSLIDSSMNWLWFRIYCCCRRFVRRFENRRWVSEIILWKATFETISSILFSF